MGVRPFTPGPLWHSVRRSQLEQSERVAGCGVHGAQERRADAAATRGRAWVDSALGAFLLLNILREGLTTSERGDRAIGLSRVHLCAAACKPADASARLCSVLGAIARPGGAQAIDAFLTFS